MPSPRPPAGNVAGIVTWLSVASLQSNPGFNRTRRRKGYLASRYQQIPTSSRAAGLAS